MSDFFALVSFSSSPPITTIATNPFIQLIIVIITLLKPSSVRVSDFVYTESTRNRAIFTSRYHRRALSRVDFAFVAASSLPFDVMS